MHDDLNNAAKSANAVEGYAASDNNALGALVQEAARRHLASVSITYRANGVEHQVWASTHTRHSGWEVVPEPLAGLARALANTLLPASWAGWGQIEVDVAGSLATIGRIEDQIESL